MYKNRTLTNTVLDISKDFKSILITGMRQVGKTTFLKNISDNERKYVTFDNPKDLLLAKNEPEFFLQTYEPPVLIDEIQYVPEIFAYIKMFVDNINEKGTVWMTGSQAYSLMKGVTESLAGRIAIINMLGLSIYEKENKAEMQKPFFPSFSPPSIINKKDLLATYHNIWKGSYPEILDIADERWSVFYSSYVQSYIERDVRQIVNIVNETSFMKFLKTTAARTAQELNITDIAKDVDISPNTVKQWLSILESSGIIYLLKPYYKNITKRYIKRPKLYFLDTGLCAYLTDWNTPQVLESGAMSGAFFETFVIGEIIKSYYHNGQAPTFYYYRDTNKVEIDLLIERDGSFYPIEIKKTSNPDTNDIKAFATFAKIEQCGYGSLICLTDNARPLTDNANAISIWDI
ncbi:MAG: ATP-binding protein [Elusimicrobiota bacterium]|jgi:predicted AAA+ superfamily ATPase|nr:ATP-binding protein [Elusimicrobiota bacterium]